MNKRIFEYCNEVKRKKQIFFKHNSRPNLVFPYTVAFVVRTYNSYLWCKNLECYSIHAHPLPKKCLDLNSKLAIKPYYYSHTNYSDYFNDIKQLNGRILYQHFHQSGLLLKSQN